MHGDSAVRRKKHIAVTILFAVSVFLIQHAHTDASRSFLHYRYPMSATTNTSLQTHPGFFQAPFRQPHLNGPQIDVEGVLKMIAVLYMLIHQMIRHHWKWAGSTIKYVTIPAFVICTWYIRKCKGYMRPLSPITNKQNKQQHTSQEHSSSTTHVDRTERKRKADSDADMERVRFKLPKRGRTPIYHPDKMHCTPCMLWQQSGADPRLHQFHSSKEMRHAGSDATTIALYATYDGIQFDLDFDSCICPPCHKDFKRNYQNRENVIPRWAKLRKEMLETRAAKHCVLCCTNRENGSCECQLITHWGPDQWNGMDSLESWRKFLFLSGLVHDIIPNTCNNICRSHYRRIVEMKAQRTCCVCGMAYTDKPWKLVCDVANSTEHVCEAFSLSDDSVNFISWICTRCTLCLTDVTHFDICINQDLGSATEVIARRASAIKDTMCTLQSEGIVYTHQVLSDYRSKLNEDQLDKDSVLKAIRSLSAYLTIMAKKHAYKTYTQPATRYGRVLYNDHIFNPQSIPYIFNLKLRQWQMESELNELRLACNSNLNVSNLQHLISEQAAKFPTSGKFDFRTLVPENDQVDENALEAHFLPNLVQLVDNITTSDHSKYHPVTQHYKDIRKFRIWMVIALLCITMNPNCCFFQTLIGLICYAYGLRDKGFDVLNTLGCTCSIDHLRNHGAFWANKRKAVEELDKTRPWRISIDNLNFHIKFAKNLPGSSNGAKKMLNLITGQVTTRTSEISKHLKTESLTAMVHHTIAKLTNQAVPLTTLCFQINFESNVDMHYLMFSQSCFATTVKRLETAPLDCSETFIQSLCNFMPHYTPHTRDAVVYVTIEEAQAATLGDVEGYLIRMKRELCIGQGGFPSKVIIAGDQQTFSLMKTLQIKYPSHFNWLIIIPGDWHLLKLASELLRDLLWDGGLKQFVYNCGHKKEITQWQEINMYLIALYDALLRKAAHSYALAIGEDPHHMILHGRTFWEWNNYIASPGNCNEVSQFWAKALTFLNAYVGYYFAIRSGNWYLRNTCIKVLLPLFFAYCRDKYEELITTALKDIHSFPHDVITSFQQGEWTVSQKNRPYHNIAIDEAHECIINLRLKTITARPSHFRTVELANFMAYLDIVVAGFEEFLFCERKVKSGQIKRFTCQRAQKIYEIIHSSPLFIFSITPTKLFNIFTSSKLDLDSAVIYDLLNYPSVGMKRMLDYVEAYILPQQPTHQKRKRQLKLSTFSSRAPSRREQKSRENELQNIARNAMELLQANGITAQTCTYPLAICNIHGEMRMGQKSTFTNAMCKYSFKDAFCDFCPFLQTPTPDLCVIVDFLYYLHIPPPPDVSNFADFASFLWLSIVKVYAIDLHCRYIYIVIDKPEFLPPPRTLVHKSRSKKSGRYSGHEPQVTGPTPVPHGKSYSALLSSSKVFKANLIKYITFLFIEWGKKTTNTFKMIIDSPALMSPVAIENGVDQPYHSNQHGEADYAVWHHAIHAPSQNIVIVSSDTDTWVYGLGILENGWLQEKTVFVKQGSKNSFVHLNLAVNLITEHHFLQPIILPACSIQALYVLSGCDYVSSFFGCTKMKFLDTFLENASFIFANTKSFIHLDDNSQVTINEDAWMRLITAIYFSKHKAFFRNKTIAQTYKLLVNFPDCEESQRLLSWTGYPSTHKIVTLRDWHDFIRKVTFHASKVTCHHEAKVLPSWNALVNHSLRATYVLQLAFSSPFKQCAVLHHCTNYGWTSSSNGIEIAWNTSATIVEQVGCKCSSGCSSTRCTCYSKSKECTARCSCRECTNFNTLVAQPLCNESSSSESDTESEDHHLLSINDVEDEDYDVDI